MANRRALAWSAAMRDLRNERRERTGVREERLSTMQGLRGTPALALSAWRGRSGRRYVVGIHGVGEADRADGRGEADLTREERGADLVSFGEAVLIAVRRDRAGLAEVVDVTAAGQSPRERLRGGWMRRMRERGATEMHVHRLAACEAERHAIVADLAREGQIDR